MKIRPSGGTVWVYDRRDAVGDAVRGSCRKVLPADNFERVLPRSGWRIDYLGTTYQANLSSETIANMPRLCGRQGIADRLAPLQDQLRVIAPLLENPLVHMPFWAVAGTRLD